MGGRASWLGLGAALGLTALVGTLSDWMVVPGDVAVSDGDVTPGAGWMWCVRLLLIAFAALCLVVLVAGPSGMERVRVGTLERAGLVAGALALPLGACAALVAQDGSAGVPGHGFVLSAICHVAALFALGNAHHLPD